MTRMSSRGDLLSPPLPSPDCAARDTPAFHAPSISPLLLFIPIDSCPFDGSPGLLLLTPHLRPTSHVPGALQYPALSVLPESFRRPTAPFNSPPSQ